MKVVKPAGAKADLHELEYISALHQTGKELRKDGSIKADDISKFLMSRYGIKVTEEEVSDTISKGFGGGGLSSDDGDSLDLTEVTALLLVPTLIKAEMSLHKDHLEQEHIKAGSSENATENHDMHHRKSGIMLRESNSINPALRGEDRWPDSDLIDFVLKMILKDVTGDDQPKPMTKDLLRKIFTFYQEFDVADNDELLDGMISVASEIKNDGDEEGNGVPMFDKFTFAHCLTDDVRLYDISSESRLSTSFSDVFDEKRKDGQASISESDAPRVKTVWTAPSLDYTVDMFRSKTYVILLWVNWALFFYVFMSSSSSPARLTCSADATTGSGFGCLVAQGIVNWLLLMAWLVLIGSGSVILCSMGHNVSQTTPWMTVASILSFVSICFFTIVPAFTNSKVITETTTDDFWDDDVSKTTAVIDTTKENMTPDKIFLTYVMVGFGALLLLFALQNLLARIIPAHYIENNLVLQKVFWSGTIAMERNMKQAASFKMNQLVKNARNVHSKAEFETGVGPQSNSYGCALLSFTKMENETEETGGFIWTWKRMWNGRLYREDGIWLNNRMVQGNVAQLVLCVWLIPFLQYVLSLVTELYETLLAEIIPARWRIMLPLALSFMLAEFNAIKLATSYTPSSVRTTLRLRYGVIGSLHDAEFLKLRTAVEDVSFIFGAMFWGTLLSSVLILFTSFLIFGLFCFEPFLPTLLQIIASILGIVITIVLKMVCMIIYRKRFHERAFYRTTPWVANIVGVILEAWSLGISTLYVVKRVAFLLSAAFIFVGRIDIPLLSQDADQLGPFTIDGFPFTFRKDLVSHEAHRHPYIERIGVMYMMKLKYGDGFGRESGTSWRLLFVFALLPWLRKYRLRAGDDGFDVNNFAFSRSSAAYDKFANAKAQGLRGRMMLHKSMKEESKDSTEDDPNDDNGPEGDNSDVDDSALNEALVKEVAMLREENARLKQRLEDKSLSNVN